MQHSNRKSGSASNSSAGRGARPGSSGSIQRGSPWLALPKLPPAAIDHLKYPIVVDSDAFKRATDYHHRYDERETIDAFRAAR